MIYWLDNCDNHDGTPNENYGRELMETVLDGNRELYRGRCEDGGARVHRLDIYRSAAAAFRICSTIPVFEYREWDHDDSEKTFLGETGKFNGEDIIDIIVKQPATGQFLARHLYNFFVADEPQVPAWPYTPPNDPDAVNTLAQAYIDSGYEMRAVLETLFKSDFFKEATFRKVKSPLELVSNTVRMTGDFNVEMGTFPKHGLTGLAATVGFMGQQVFNPPSVEGWHTGKEWIDSGALVQRVNFAAEQVGDTDMPGVRLMLDKLADDTASMSPQGLVDGCLRLMGDLELEADTHSALVQHVAGSGALRADTAADRDRFDERATEMMQLIVATPEYQSE